MFQVLTVLGLRMLESICRLKDDFERSLTSKFAAAVSPLMAMHLDVLAHGWCPILSEPGVR